MEGLKDTRLEKEGGEERRLEREGGEGREGPGLGRGEGVMVERGLGRGGIAVTFVSIDVFNEKH